MQSFAGFVKAMGKTNRGPNSSLPRSLVSLNKAITSDYLLRTLLEMATSVIIWQLLLVFFKVTSAAEFVSRPLSPLNINYWNANAWVLVEGGYSRKATRWSNRYRFWRGWDPGTREAQQTFPGWRPKRLWALPYFKSSLI